MSEVVPVEKTSCFATKNSLEDIRQSVGRSFELPLEAEVGKRLGQSSRHIIAEALAALGGVTKTRIWMPRQERRGSLLVIRLVVD